MLPAPANDPAPLLIRCGYEIALRCERPTPLVCRLSIHDDRRDDMRMEAFSVSPPVPVSYFRDLYGNRCLRLTAPAGELTLRGDATVADDGRFDPDCRDARELPVAELPDDCLEYLSGSRYCETDRLSQVAWDMFGGLAPGWGRVRAICDFVHHHLRFDYTQARATRTAYEAFHERVGVCRDYAHLALTLCRCLNIPARYVNGHLGDIGVPPAPEPMDFCAWIEVFLDGRWHTFDPRNNVPRIGRVVIARGRDAVDVPMVHSFGPHTLTAFRVWTEET